LGGGGVLFAEFYCMYLLNVSYKSIAHVQRTVYVETAWLSRLSSGDTGRNMLNPETVGATKTLIANLPCSI